MLVPDHTPKVKVRSGLLPTLCQGKSAGHCELKPLWKDMLSWSAMESCAARAQDFFQKECWAHHPKPYTDFMKWRADEDARWAAERQPPHPGRLEHVWCDSR